LRDETVLPPEGRTRLASSATTTVKPRVSVQNSSRTEMSKESEVTASQVPGSAPTLSSIPAKKFITLRWLTTTPFGLPVEPEV
jgi:hypothetical protein